MKYEPTVVKLLFFHSAGPPTALEREPAEEPPCFLE